MSLHQVHPALQAAAGERKRSGESKMKSIRSCEQQQETGGKEAGCAVYTNTHTHVHTPCPWGCPAQPAPVRVPGPHAAPNSALGRVHEGAAPLWPALPPPAQCAGTHTHTLTLGLSHTHMHTHAYAHACKAETAQLPACAGCRRTHIYTYIYAHAHTCKQDATVL